MTTRLLPVLLALPLLLGAAPAASLDPDPPGHLLVRVRGGTFTFIVKITADDITTEIDRQRLLAAFQREVAKVAAVRGFDRAFEMESHGTGLLPEACGADPDCDPIDFVVRPLVENPERISIEMMAGPRKAPAKHAADIKERLCRYDVGRRNRLQRCREDKLPSLAALLLDHIQAKHP